MRGPGGSLEGGREVEPDISPVSPPLSAVPPAAAADPVTSVAPDPSEQAPDVLAPAGCRVARFNK